MRILKLLPFLFAVQMAHATSDVLANRTLTINNPNPAAALDAVMADLPGFFHGYTPAIDSGTKLISPLQVSGSQSHPILTMTIQKCVLIICQTVTFDGEVSFQTVQGKCQRNYEIDVALSHSSDALRNVYDRFSVDLCLNSPSAGTGMLLVSAAAERAPTFQPGEIQQIILNFLNLQVQPISAALQKKIAAH
jgi:hypothetical protein